MSLTFQPIHQGHDRKRFDCGKEPLNRFLRETARRNEERHITSTFVLVDTENESHILGYFTLVFCEVDIPSGSPLKDRYPHPIQGVRLARMAVDTGYQGKGYGQHMLIAAIIKTCQADLTAPVHGLFVDAKDEQAQRFYEKFQFVPVTDDSRALWLSIAQCRAVMSEATG